MEVKFNENTRVQVPALLHLCKLGYTYLSNVGNYDHKTNILTDVFKRSVKRLNPFMSDLEIDQLLSKIVLMSSNDDLGREFYQLLTSISGIKLINYDDASANEWHCTSEFTCEEKESGENFRPDITCFINGLPLAFIEVKKPNNIDGILAERERINTRMSNKKFRTFLNLTQLMIFSNNQKYDNENRVPIQGAFYASISKTKAFFNVFREQNVNLYQECNPVALDEDVEKEILIHRNCVTIRNAPEYLSNQKPDTPTNSIITSMLSRNRFLFILRYGFAYVEKKIETESGEKITRLEKHVMRYQQLFASLAVRDKLNKGIKSGIIWHTQGSGKTALAFYSVRSLTDYFAKKNIAVKFYFIVDRIDLLEQAKGEFVAPYLVIVLLLVSIAVKLYMASYNRSIGKKIGSTALMATGLDALSDSVSTAVVLLSILVTRWTGLLVDGWCGIAVACFILYAGFNAAKDTIDPLLGTPPTPEFVDNIESLVMAYPDVLGIHDLIVHDYGPGRCMISLHAEVPASGDILELHDLIDSIEMELRQELDCEAVIHMDPVVMDDALTTELRMKAAELVKTVHPEATIHDFRMVVGPTHTNLIFDAAVPFGGEKSNRQIEEEIKAKVRQMEGTYFAVVRVENSYV